ELRENMRNAIQASQDFNDEMIQNLNRLDKSFQRSIYNVRVQIKAEVNPVDGLESTQESTFDLVKDILNAARRTLELEKVSSSDIKIPDLINFIYQNLINGEAEILSQLVSLEIEEGKRILNNSKIINQAFLFCSLGLVIIVFAYIVTHEKKF